MKSGLYLLYSELTDAKPNLAELIALLKQVPLAHGVDALSRLNLLLRYSLSPSSVKSVGQAQNMFCAGYLDDELLNLAKQRFSTTRLDDKPIFLPFSTLNVLRQMLLHSDGSSLPKNEDDERVRHLIGRACLMMNDLLVSEEETKRLFQGAADQRRIELIVQMMPNFELTNAAKDHHLVPRLQIMYRTLLRDDRITKRIAAQCKGFNFDTAFRDAFGIPLEKWLFIVFSVYAYFLNGAVTEDPKYFMLDSSIFRGNSHISDKELEIVLKTISATPTELHEKILEEKVTDPRYDMVELRSKPIIQMTKDRFIPIDVALIIDKCYTGVQWILHDALPKERLSLFEAWGVLFEEYVHWLFGGMKTNTLIKYTPSPHWSDTGDESVDGLLRKGSSFMLAEYKGGFLSRAARYSGVSAVFINDLEKTFVPGCRQLADKIGMLFASDPFKRRRLSEIGVDHAKTVLPTLILQEHITRMPFLNWYMNKRFREFLADWDIRSGLTIHSLTLINISDLETIVASAEGTDMQFISALENRAMQDTEMLSDLSEFLRSHPAFGRSRSARLDSVMETLWSELAEAIFPGQSAS